MEQTSLILKVVKIKLETTSEKKFRVIYGALGKRNRTESFKNNHVRCKKSVLVWRKNGS